MYRLLQYCCFVRSTSQNEPTAPPSPWRHFMVPVRDNRARWTITLCTCLLWNFGKGDIGKKWLDPSITDLGTRHCTRGTRVDRVRLRHARGGLDRRRIPHFENLKAHRVVQYSSRNKIIGSGLPSPSHGPQNRPSSDAVGRAEGPVGVCLLGSTISWPRPAATRDLTTGTHTPCFP
jgi:hypothetical protein